MAIYFTSDLHLGHKKAIVHSGRPFADVDQMNQILIQNINNTVRTNDELWILGDFAYTVRQTQVRQFRSQIQCEHVHLVYGNHDKNSDPNPVFQSVQHYKELKTEYGRIVLFHYPILDWNAKHYGSIHLHGHIHSTGEYNAANLAKDTDEGSFSHHARYDGLGYRIYDVGVDANHYRPISLEQIAILMGIEPITQDKP